MKINFICFKFSKLIFFTTCLILIILIFFRIQIKKEKTLQMSLAPKKSYNNTIVENTVYSSKKQIKIQIEKKTRVMPEKLKGFEIIGKIKIPKLNVEKYILSETSSKSLKVSVAKVCGPQINKIGNFCIAGHNYNKVFGKIKTLEKNDQIILTDVYGSSTTYQIYNKYKISPKDISCLNQNTENEKEITLITCTAGATKRVIIKAVEIYD